LLSSIKRYTTELSSVGPTVIDLSEPRFLKAPGASKSSVPDTGNAIEKKASEHATPSSLHPVRVSARVGVIADIAKITTTAIKVAPRPLVIGAAATRLNL
jgi:hypothetical protein